MKTFANKELSLDEFAEILKSWRTRTPAENQSDDMWAGTQLDHLVVGGELLDGETGAILKSDEPKPVCFNDIDQSLCTRSPIRKSQEAELTLRNGFDSLESARGSTDPDVSISGISI